MELMHRFGDTSRENYVDDYIKIIKDNKGSGDVVWLSTCYGYPSLEKHKEHAEKQKEVAKKLREAGLKVSLQISNTLGHGEYMSSRDCSGLTYEGSPAEYMVGPNGEVCEYSYCWNGKFVREYFLESLKYYMDIKPDVVWPDDDFRAVHHVPVNFGCFCDDCIAKFNVKHNVNFERKELVEKILQNGSEWREKWVEFVREGMSDLMRAIAKVVHEYSPDSAMGLQYGAHGAYTGKDYRFILDPMYEETGKNTYTRPGGGSYNDHDPNTFVGKAVALSYLNARLPEHCTRRCPEIESLPHISFGKTPEGNAFESSLYFAFGNTDMTYSIMMSQNEELSWYNEILKNFSKCRKYWDRISEVNLDSYQAGARYFLSNNIHNKPVSENGSFDDRFREQTSVPYMHLKDMHRDAMPICYDQKDDSLTIVHAEMASSLSDEEIANLLTKNVIIDAESLDILGDRLDIGVKVHLAEAKQMLRMYEKFDQSHVTCPKGLARFTYSFFSQGRSTSYWMEDLTGKAEVIAWYERTNENLPYFVEGAKYPLGIAEMVIKTKQGGTWGIFAYCPWKNLISSKKRDQILNVWDYVSGNKLCARILTRNPNFLLPRKRKDGKVVCASIVNPTISESKNDVLFIKNPASTKFEFMGMDSKCKKLKAKPYKDGYIVTIPKMKAWTVGTVFCDK